MQSPCSRTADVIAGPNHPTKKQDTHSLHANFRLATDQCRSYKLIVAETYTVSVLSCAFTGPQTADTIVIAQRGFQITRVTASITLVGSTWLSKNCCTHLWPGAASYLQNTGVAWQLLRVWLCCNEVMVI